MYVFIFYVLSYVATIDRLMRRTVLRLVPMLSNSLFAIRNSTCLPPHNPWPAILGNKAFLPDDYPKALDQCPWCLVAAKCCENPAVCFVNAVHTQTTGIGHTKLGTSWHSSKQDC
jgi:hypothetical protein